MKLGIEKTKFTKVSEIQIPEIFYRRMLTGIKEFDELFGDGILPGSAFTVTAQAGCGKTTFLLQLCEALAATGYDVGYASGEENQYQLAFNCKRLNVRNVNIANETDVDTLAAEMKNLDILIVDSFQALTTKHKLNHAELERYAVTTLISAAKRTECAVVFVMHLTKNGLLKGSTLVPHSVDVNMQIELDPEVDETARLINIYKNRFGTCGNYSAMMTARGFELSGKKEVVKAKSKKSRYSDQLDAIMAINEPPHITKEVVIKTLKVTSSQAYLLLKELTDSGMLKKFGRGQSAIFKKGVTANQAVTA
jgi:predicted ATP-dependent serine protease